MPHDTQRGIGDPSNDEQNNLPTGKSWFFGIGIDAYQDDRIPNLTYAVRDVEAIYQRLKEDYDLEEDTSYHHFLLNDQATRRAIIVKFNALKSQLQPGDKVLIYYAGHGETIDDDGYWKPYDAEEGQEDTYITNERLRQLIKRLKKARHVLVLMDSCYSGSFLAEASRGSGRNINRLDEDPSRFAICSGGPKEAVLDNSPFARYLLDQLDKNQEEWLDSQELALHVRNLTLSNYYQKPRFGPIQGLGHEGGSYLFRRKTAEEAFWKSCVARGTLSAYSEYLERYPQGTHAAQALEYIRDLEDDQEWQRALQIDMVYAYQQYLFRFPGGKHEKEARERIRVLTSKSGTSSPTPSKPKPKGESAPIFNPDSNTFTDPRDGQTYKTVRLNGQIWMAENLNYDAGEGCWHYENDPENGKKYGRLYTWESAKRACPPGWRLPTDEEWKSLANAYGGYYDHNSGKVVSDPKQAYEALIEGGNSGFSAQLGGYRGYNGSFGYLGGVGRCWSATEYGSGGAWYYYFYRGSGKLNRNWNYKSSGQSCRCVQDI